MMLGTVLTITTKTHTHILHTYFLGIAYDTVMKADTSRDIPFLSIAETRRQLKVEVEFL